MAAIDYILCGVIIWLLAALAWMHWLYITTYRRLLQSDRDRDRLIRRVGLYHSLPLSFPVDNLPEIPPDTPVPPAFRTRRPQPPPGYRKS
jgi:hypothetical protein